jgi:hypothetical protein
VNQNVYTQSSVELRQADGEPARKADIVVLR